MESVIRKLESDLIESRNANKILRGQRDLYKKELEELGVRINETVTKNAFMSFDRPDYVQTRITLDKSFGYSCNAQMQKEIERNY